MMIPTATPTLENPFKGSPPPANGRHAPKVDGDSLYEIVDGNRVEKEMSLYANLMANVLSYFLQRYADETKTGRAMTETMFDLPGVNQVRRPDCAFVTFNTWPLEKPIPRGDVWAIAPDLAVEVISPTNTWEAEMRKVREYFKAKVKLVWVILPSERLIYVHRSLKDVRLLDPTDELTGDDVLPGFRLPISELFARAGTEEPES
jgi:Uma2 family endonuclease